jgi:hypothetical protein
VLAHLGRAGGAVEADELDAERFERGESGPDLRAEQHGAGGLDGHLHHDRQVGAGGLQGAARADERGLGLQQVLTGLDEQCVRAAGDEARCLLLIPVAQRGI